MIQVGVWHRETESGFTLVELLVAMVISLVVMGGIYSTYHSQQKSYLVQEQVAAMQQNLRSAMYNMAREVRMAGYDPTGGSGAGMVSANANSVQFTMDITGGEADGVDNDSDGLVDADDLADEARYGDGNSDDANENISYALYDADGDGDNDLGRNDVNDAGIQLIAENIDALNFVYLDEDGNVTANLSDIKSIEVSIVARTGRGDRGFTNIKTYKNLQDQNIYTAPGDNFRRRLLTCEIKSRNLGLGL